MLPKGVAVTHANIQANIDHFNYWMPYREGGVHLHAAPVFHILDFPLIFAAPAFGTCQVTIPKFIYDNLRQPRNRPIVNVVAVIVLVVMVVPVYIAQRLAGGGESATGGGQRAALRSETEPGL